MSDRRIALAIFLLAAAVIFPNLGDRCLWQDEAETALIASNVLRTGLPTAWDGRLLVTQDDGRELTDSLLWAWTPWAMHYVAAAGMAAFGESSFGARWLFALLGCLTFPMFYRLVLDGTRDRAVALLAAVLMLTSVQYLLLMRQCRYYALLPVLFIVSLRGYTLLPSTRGLLLLSIGLALLFHSNYVASAIVASGLLLHAVLRRRGDATWKPLIASGVVLAAAGLPWLAATGLLNRTPTTDGFLANIVGTLVMSNRYVCPWPVILALVVEHAWRRKPVGSLDGLGACVLVPMFYFVPAFLWPNPRYVSFLLPVGCLLAARAIRETWRWSRSAGVVLAATLVGTNVLVLPVPALLPTGVGRQYAPGEIETGDDALRLGLWKSELAGYLHELTHSTRGPDEELVAFVESHAAPDDAIFVTNDALPVMFHTRRRLAGVLTPEALSRAGWSRLPRYLSDITCARWIILRAGQPLTREEVAGELRRRGVRIAGTLHLDIDDVRWINRPMVSKHVFRMPERPPSGVDVLLLDVPGSDGGSSTR